MLPQYAEKMEPSTDAPPSGYLLTKIAQESAARFAERIAALDIRPKHYGLLTVVAANPSASQQQLGRLLGLVPSAIVTMIDDLEARSAVVRDHDPTNRRQFAINITPTGRALLAEATALGAQVDDEVLGGLSDSARSALHMSLVSIARRLDLLPQ